MYYKTVCAMCLVTGNQEQLVPIDNHCIAVFVLHALQLLSIMFLHVFSCFIGNTFSLKLNLLWNIEYDGSIDGAFINWLTVSSSSMQKYST